VILKSRVCIVKLGCQGDGERAVGGNDSGRPRREQGLQATQQGLQLAVEASEQTEQVIQEAELEAAVLSALGTKDYEELTVADISKKLDDFSTEDLKKLRVYEKQNKNRETLIDQIDRKIKAATS